MANNPKRTNAAANAACNAMTALLNGGDVQIRTGAQPANADAAATGTLLATLPLSATAFAAAVDGVATANAITDDVAADATGTATWFRARTSGGVAVIDGSVGVSGADLNMNSVDIQAGALVEMTSWTVTESKG